MSFNYLASPYTHPDHAVMEQRYQEAMRCLFGLLRQRRWVYSPIVHCHELAKAYNLPRDFTFWSEYNEQMLRASSRLLILTLDGWQESRGVTHEALIAHDCGLAVEFIAPT